ncbi:MAG TPA: hypothetical protein VFE53_01990 [Mucilaginibacter sp.]|jgi:hypothetical protein|nr:hypothetical protein [Mucilaginibacter sp.]
MEKALSNFASKLNWRLIAVHFAACWLFIYAFKELVILHDFSFWMSMINHSKSWFKTPTNWDYDVSRLRSNFMWLNLSGCAGFLIAFFISIMITIKKHWFWVNSLIVFLIGCALGMSNLLGWDYLKYIFLAPGHFFKFDSIWYFIVNGTVMLVIALLLFFLKIIRRFVSPTNNPGNI